MLPPWRTQAGLDLVGPRYFGIDTDYIPVEERSAEGGVRPCTNWASTWAAPARAPF
ncbi:MAG: hypothetical protein ACLSVD_10220 [Eggerthellaceae bacterium]